MINIYSVRKWITLTVLPIISTTLFYFGLVYYKSFIIALAFLFAGLIINIIMGNLLLNSPFRDMVEGKGILTLDFNSTGVIRPFIIQVSPPFLNGKINGKAIRDIFDRAAVWMMRTPIKTKKIVEIKDSAEGGLKIDINEEEYNKGRFALFHYPVLIWNSQIGSIMTKDLFSEVEKNAFAKHTILYLNRVIEELSSQIRDFARYVVESTRPKGSIFENKWVIGIIVIGIIIMIILFAKPLISTIGGFAGNAQSAVGVATGNAINPLG